MSGRSSPTLRIKANSHSSLDKAGALGAIGVVLRAITQMPAPLENSAPALEGSHAYTSDVPGESRAKGDFEDRVAKPLACVREGVEPRACRGDHQEWCRTFEALVLSRDPVVQSACREGEDT